MKLALLAADESCVELARAAGDSSDHRVVRICRPQVERQQLHEICPHAEWDDDWETLLLASQLDAIIVGRMGADETLWAEPLRRLVQDGMSLMIVHPAADSLVLHELDMIRADSHSMLVPYVPQRLHPAVLRMLELAAQGDRNSRPPWEQIIVQREIRGGRREVLSQLSCDAVVLEEFAGQLSRVSALAPPGEEKTFANLAVNLSGDQNVLVRWSCQSGGQLGGKISLVGPSQQITLVCEDVGPWSLDWQENGQPRRQEFDSSTVAPAALEMLQQCLAGQSPPVNWLAACRAVEVTEGVEESVRRGRTIHLYFQQHSQKQSFKGVMAAGGCFLLLATLLAVLAGAVIDGLGMPFRQNFWWRIWPLYVFAPIFLFLLLQILLRVFAEDSSRLPPPGSETEESNRSAL